MDQPVIIVSPEVDWNLALEQSKEVSRTEQTDGKGGQVRDGCRMVEETTIGVEVAGETPVPYWASQMELVCGSWGDEIVE